MQNVGSKTADHEECFKDLVDFPGYQVGDRGTVRCWKKCKKEWKVLRLNKVQGKLPTAELRREGQKTRVQVARLVLIAHVAYKAPGELRSVFVCFKDGDCSNMRAENLEWASVSLRKPSAKLTPTDVADIRARLSAEGVRNLAREYNVAENTIRCILKGQTW